MDGWDGWSGVSGVQLPCGLGVVLWAWHRRRRDIVRRRRTVEEGWQLSLEATSRKGGREACSACYHGRTSTHCSCQSVSGMGWGAISDKPITI